MEGEKLSYNGISLKDDCASVSNVKWVFMKKTSNPITDIESVVSCDEDSISSSVSSDIEEDGDDATSSSSSSPSAPGPLYELSKLMDHLPIKRGLSNYFQGKSQSFTSLGSVRSLEDLAKKENPYRKKAKTCYNRYGPNAIITKISCSRSSKGTFISSLGKRGSTFVSIGRFRPSISLVQKHF